MNFLKEIIKQLRLLEQTARLFLILLHRGWNHIWLIMKLGPVGESQGLRLHKPQQTQL